MGNFRFWLTLLCVGIITALLIIIINGEDIDGLYVDTDEVSVEDKANEGAISAVSPQEYSDLKVPVYYYGVGCPACNVLDEWLEENNAKDKVEFLKEEVYYNTENSQELARIAAGCGLSVDHIGVPFLYTGNRCLIGVGDIVGYFESRIKESAGQLEQGNL